MGLTINSDVLEIERVTEREEIQTDREREREREGGETNYEVNSQSC